jgi:hypothetical protein
MRAKFYSEVQAAILEAPAEWSVATLDEAPLAESDESVDLLAPLLGHAL